MSIIFFLNNFHVNIYLFRFLFTFDRGFKSEFAKLPKSPLLWSNSIQLQRLFHSSTSFLLFNQLVSSSESQLLIELSDPTSIPHPFKFASLAGAEALSASFCRNKTCIAGHLTTGYRLFSLEFQLSCSPCSPPWPQFTSPAGESFSSCN